MLLTNEPGSITNANKDSDCLTGEIESQEDYLKHFDNVKENCFEDADPELIEEKEKECISAEAEIHETKDKPEKRHESESHHNVDKCLQTDYVVVR